MAETPTRPPVVLDLEPVTEEARIEYESRPRASSAGVRFVRLSWPRGGAGWALAAALAVGCLLFFYVILPIILIVLAWRLIAVLLRRLRASF